MASSATAAYVRARLITVLDATLGYDVDVLTSQLLAQPNAVTFRDEAKAVFGLEVKTPATLRIEAVIDDIVNHVYGGKKKKKFPQQQQKKKQQVTGRRLAVNCLKCGFVNGVIAEDIGTSSYEDHVRAVTKIRDQWPSCSACGASLKEQLRHGDVDDPQLSKAVALASRLVLYDRDTAKRTSVVDDQIDWYAPPDAASSSRSGGHTITFTLDFAGRKVQVSETDDDYSSLPPLSGSALDALIISEEDDCDDGVAESKS